MTKPSPEDYTQCSVGAMQAAAAVCCLGNANRKQSVDVQDRCRLKKNNSQMCVHICMHMEAQIWSLMSFSVTVHLFIETGSLNSFQSL